MKLLFQFIFLINGERCEFKDALNVCYYCDDVKGGIGFSAVIESDGIGFIKINNLKNSKKLFTYFTRSDDSFSD